MIITKEREEKDSNRRVEFPKLILEEENINKTEIEKSPERTLSTREIITFLLFCFFYIVVVYLQMDVESNFAMNTAIKKGLNNNAYEFKEINIESNYWLWIKNFVNNLYRDNYYGDFEIPSYKQHAIPNLNILVSKIRIT